MSSFDDLCLSYLEGNKLLYISSKASFYTLLVLDKAKVRVFWWLKAKPLNLSFENAINRLYNII